MVSPKGRERAAVTISTHRDAHNPPVELPSSSASNFFEEAQAGAAEEAELRRKFQKFASKSSAELSEPDVLTFEDFTRLLEHYDTTSLASLVPYFYAIDRNRDGKLDFQEFFLGSVAADPQTVHILNSFTGRERANFTFDYYDVNRSGFLELEEFQKVCRDCALPSLDEHALRRHTFEKARDLGLMEESQRRGRVLDDESSFIPPNQKQFYEFISTERLRGTSRLFRFQKTLIKQRSRPKRAVLAPEPVDGTELPPAEGDTEDATTEEPSDYEDVDGLFFDNEESPRIASQDARTMPYTDLLPVAPPCELHLDTEKGLDDAFQIAAEVLKGLSHSNFEGLIPPADGSFTLATADDICALCNAAAILMKDEDMVLTHLQPPLKVFGALHGQIWDLLSHFKWHFRPTEDEGHGDLLYMSYLFLGDYADRGSHSLEVLTILLSLKVLHPNRISLLRGHHENRHVNYHLGLREECEKRLGTGAMEVYEQLNRTFEHMSLAANMGGKMLALGPGIVSSSLHRLDQLRKYRKPLYLPHPLQQRPEKAERLNEQVLLELFTPSDLLQPEGCEREAEQVKAFCAMQKLNAVVASRQIPATGFAFDFGNRLIRVCSCVNYCDLRRGNLAAILYVVQQDESSAVTIRPKVLAAYPDRKDFLSGRPLLPTPSRAPVNLRWPRQSRAPTPGRLRDTQADETGHPVTSIRLLEDQATAAVEDETVHFPVLSFAKASPQG